MGGGRSRRSRGGGDGRGGEDEAAGAIDEQVNERTRTADVTARRAERLAERARRHGEGHLHRLFDNQARSLAETIWHLRMEACRKDLERGELAAVGIGAVAAYWGFTDQAHFSRRFKAAYGMNPREWRAGVGPSWLAQKSGHGDG